MTTLRADNHGDNVKMASTKKSLADFKAAHDKSFIVPAKIKAGLEKLGADGWEYEMDFAKLCGLGNNDLARYREQFTAHVVVVKNQGGKGERRVWAGTKTLALKMQEMANNG